jgi:5-methyltetrahydropteroyltriglutamate--homocysteine methyltransferase
MQRSEKRILTTHAGSLPRPAQLADMLARLSRHEPVDNSELEQAIEESIRRVVRMQAECGIDVGNNG